MAAFDETVRFQVIVQRLKAGVVRDASDQAGESLSELVAGVLANASVAGMTRSRLEAFLSSLESRAAEALEAVFGEMLPTLRELAVQAAEHEAEALGVEVPDRRSIARAALEAEVPADGLPAPLLAGVFAALVDDQARRIRMAVRTLAYRRQSNDEIRQAVVGPRSKKNRGAEIGKTRRRVAAFADLAVQHVAERSRERVWIESAGVRRFRWASILDSRTCLQCAPLDGQEFVIGPRGAEGPVPPIHPRCRCFAVALTDEDVDRSRGVRPSADGEVPATTTYFEWLRGQPADFQDAAIGPKRARLLRSGGLSAAEFRRLQLDRNWNPATLDEMKALRPLAFRRAGLDEPET